MKKGIFVLLSVMLFGCGGGGGSETTPLPTQTAAPKSFNIETIQASVSEVKTFQLTWGVSQGATSYQVCLKNTSKPDNCEALGVPVSTTQTEITLDKVLLNDKLDFFIMASNSVGKTSSNEKIPDATAITAAIGYYKASNPEAGDYFGTSVSLSADGATLAVGAFGEDSNATGVGGDQTDNSTTGSGAVYVFTRTGGAWMQQAYVKASNPDIDDQFGNSVSLSADGTTLAVGAYGEGSNATGVDGDQADNSAAYSGAVYVYIRTGEIWTQQAYVKASNSGADDKFGHSVSFSGDGTTLAVAAYGEDSNALGVDGDQADNSAEHSGAVYVFVRTGEKWAQQAYVKASNTEADDRFGYSMSLSADGTTLAVGAHGEDSSAVGVDGDQADNSADYSGAVYVYTRTAGVWTQQAYVKASNTEAYDGFGEFSVSLSADGTTLAVTAPGEDSNAIGVGGDQVDNSVDDSGAVYVFTRTAGVWTQQAYVKASNPQIIDYFGSSLALSADGTTLAAGAYGEDSNAVGIGGDQTDNSIFYSGAVYVFTLTDGVWAQQAYVKAPNPGVRDGFSLVMSLSADGTTLALGAHGEDSNAVGVGGDPMDNSAIGSGAVYLY